MTQDRLLETVPAQTEAGLPLDAPAQAAQKSQESGATLDRLTVCRVDDSILNHEAAAYRIWRQIIESCQCTTPIDHPDYVLADIGAGFSEFPTQLLLCDPESPAPAAAVLAPRVIPASKFSRFMGSMNLKVMRLVGSRVYSAGSTDNERRLVQAAVHQASSSGSDALYIEDIDIESPFLSQISSKFSIWEPFGRQPHHQIRFPDRPEDYWNKFKSKTLKRARNRIRKLGDCELKVFSSADDVSLFLTDANQISLNSWKRSQLGIRISNSEREEQILIAMAVHGFLRSFILYREGQPIAFELGYQKQDQYLSVECAYDGRLAELSPGQVMQHLVIEELCRSNTPAVYDFGFGDSILKRSFGNHSYQSANVMAVCPQLMSQLKVAALKQAVQVERLTRSVLQRTGLIRGLRQSLRRVK